MRSFAVALVVATITAVSAWDSPWQIHTVITGKEGELAVEWATDVGDHCSSEVQYGPTASFGKTVTGVTTPFEQYTVQHNALLTGLPSNTTVFYRVGGDDSCGETLSNLAQLQLAIPAKDALLRLPTWYL